MSDMSDTVLSVLERSASRYPNARRIVEATLDVTSLRHPMTCLDKGHPYPIGSAVLSEGGSAVTTITVGTELVEVSLESETVGGMAVYKTTSSDHSIPLDGEMMSPVSALDDPAVLVTAAVAPGMLIAFFWKPTMRNDPSVPTTCYLVVPPGGQIGYAWPTDVSGRPAPPPVPGSRFIVAALATEIDIRRDEGAADIPFGRAITNNGVFDAAGFGSLLSEDIDTVYVRYAPPPPE
jgi:hypothetical protein